MSGVLLRLVACGYSTGYCVSRRAVSIRRTIRGGKAAPVCGRHVPASSCNGGFGAAETAACSAGGVNQVERNATVEKFWARLPKIRRIGGVQDWEKHVLNGPKRQPHRRCAKAQLTAELAPACASVYVKKRRLKNHSRKE